MLRPSINTNILSAKRPPKPRAVTDQLLASIRATCRPGTMRSTSGMLLTPERRMSSCVITYTAPAVWLSFCSLRPGELTSTFIRVSRLASARSPGDCGGVSLAQQAPARSITRGVAARDSPEKRAHNLAESAITMPIGGAHTGLYGAKNREMFGLPGHSAAPADGRLAACFGSSAKQGSVQWSGFESWGRQRSCWPFERRRVSAGYHSTESGRVVKEQRSAAGRPQGTGFSRYRADCGNRDSAAAPAAQPPNAPQRAVKAKLKCPILCKVEMSGFGGLGRGCVLF